MQRRHASRFVLVCAGVIGVLASSAIHPQSAFAVITERTFAGGTFSASGEWSNGVPRTGDTAVFNLTDSYTLTFLSNRESDDAQFNDGTVTLDSKTRFWTWTLNDDVHVDAALRLDTLDLAIGDLLDVGNGGTLSILSDSDVSASRPQIGVDGDGTIIVDGTGSTLDFPDAANDILIGQYGYTGIVTFRNSAGGSFAGLLGVAKSTLTDSTGEFNVQSGASIETSGEVQVGAGARIGQLGTLTVTGDGSIFEQTGDADITVGAAADSIGNVVLRDGGTLTTGTGLLTIDPTGAIDFAIHDPDNNIDNNTTLNLNGDVLIDDGRLVGVDGDADIEIAPGTSWTVQNDGYVNVVGAWFTGNTVVVEGADTFFQSSLGLSLGGGAQMTIRGGAEVRSFSGPLFVRTADGGANVIVEGIGTVLAGPNGEEINQTYVGGYGHHGSLTVRDQAVAHFGQLYVARSGTEDSNGVVEIASGAAVDIASLWIADSELAGVSGTVTVTGNNAAVSVEGGRAVVGADSLSTGTLEVLFGGQMTLGTGSSYPHEVWNTGSVRVEDATLDVQHDFSVIGGTVETIGTGQITLSGPMVMTVEPDSTVDLAGALVAPADVTLQMNGGSLAAADVAFDPAATLNFQAGTITVRGGTLDLGVTSASINGSVADDVSTFVLADGALAEVTYAWRIGADAGTFGATEVGGGSAARSILRNTGGGAGADLIVGDGGTGSLLVNSGGLVEFNDDFVVGDDAVGDGTVTVFGTAAAERRSTVTTDGGTSSSNVVIGNAGDGELFVQAGGLVRGFHHVLIGAGSGSNGTVEVSGVGITSELVGSTLQAFARNLDVGVNGTGQLDVLDGGQAIAGDDVNIGTGTTGERTGEVTVGGSLAGIDATLQVGEDLWLGTAESVGQIVHRGTGTLLIEDGGRVEVAQRTTVGNGDRIDVNGGVLETGNGPTSLIKGSQLNIHGGDVHFGGDLLIDFGTLTKTGGALHLADDTTWTIEKSGRASLQGDLLVDTSTQFDVLSTGDLTVGGELRLDGRSAVNLLGGTLRVGSIALPDGTFQFNSGTFHVTDSVLPIDVAGPIGGLVGLDAAKRIIADVGVDVAPGATVVLTGGTLTAGQLNNAGNLLATGADSQVTVDSLHNTSEINLNNGSSLQADDDSTNDGQLTAVAGSLQFGGLLTNNGRLDVLDGTLDVPGGLVNNGTLTLVNSAVTGPVESPAGAAIVVSGVGRFGGDVQGGAHFTGGGTAMFEAAYAPGDSPAAVGFDGHVRFAPTAEFQIELEGPLAGDEHDQVNVSQSVQFAGTMQVAVLPPEQPAPGDHYVLMTYGSRTGTFDAVDTPTLQNGFWHLDYDPNQLELSVIEQAQVVGRHLAYQGSAFGGEVAPDRVALLPGDVATPENLSSFDRGINAVVIDVDHLPLGTALGAGQFAFRVGNSNDLSQWTPAPAPLSITVDEAAGTGGADRIRIVWADGAIENGWLEVTMPAGDATGLLQDDVFYFASAVAETGNRADDALVTAADVIAVRDHPRGAANLAPIGDPYDFNRDRLVDVRDMLIARNGVTSPLAAVRLLDLRVAPAQQAVPEPSSFWLAVLGLSLTSIASRRPRRPEVRPVFEN